MKKIKLLILVFFFLNFNANSQDCKFWDEGGYSGGLWELNIGQSVEINLDGCFLCGPETPSWKLLNPNASILIERIILPDAYPFMLVYSEEDSPFIFGTDQYDDIGPIRVTCQQKCTTESCLPQPTAWIPVDKSSVNGAGTDLELVPGHRMLMLRKAFLWENAEDLGCCHGPWASVGIQIHTANLLTDYNNNFEAIAGDYCGVGDNNFGNNCNYLICALGFLNNYPTFGGIKLPGPIFSAHNDCDGGITGGQCLWIGDDPKSEWNDGPWGCCYSNIAVFDWDAENHPGEVSILLREGDDTNCDDFLGAMLVSRDMQGPILFKAWHFGWVILENVDVISSTEPSVDIGDQYWFYNWDGIYPDENGAYNPPGQTYSQYLPLPNKSIQEMENIFPEGSNVGLIGGKFPTGTLSKPMIYKAACEPAIFDQ